MKKCRIKRNVNGELYCKRHPITSECPTLSKINNDEFLIQEQPNLSDNFTQEDTSQMEMNQADMNQVVNPGNNFQEDYAYAYNTQNFNTQNFDQNSQYSQQNFSNQRDDLVFNAPSNVNVTSNMPSVNYNAQNYPIVDYTQVVDTNHLAPQQYQQDFTVPMPLGSSLVPAPNVIDSTTQNLLVRESMGVPSQNQDAIISQLSNSSIEKLNTLNFLLESGVITYNDYFIKKRDLYFNEFEKDDSDNEK